MTETLSPPACGRCGDPGTYYPGNPAFARCDPCAFQDGLMDDNTAIAPMPQRAPDPLAILDKLAERGADAEQLKQIVELHMMIRRADAEQAFNQAMVECQAEMPVVVRAGKNEKTGKPFAPLDDINPVAKPVYTRHGFALNFSEGDCPIERHKRTLCDVRHKQGHSVQYHLDVANDGIGPKGEPIGSMNAPQASVSTGTYGQRVLLCRIFNITIGNSDKDGNSMLDLLKLTEEQMRQVESFMAQEKRSPSKLLAWLHQIPEAEVEKRGLTLDSMTQKQFHKLAAQYRTKIGGAA